MVEKRIRVVLLTENAGMRGGGESARPLHYFLGLRERGVDAHLFVHARSREELAPVARRFPGRLRFFEDCRTQRLLWGLARRMHDRAAGVTCAAAIQLITQGRQRRALRAMLADGRPTIVHQAFPISPCMPSRFARLGAPVVIGPMNGNMDYPPAFRTRDPWPTRAALIAARRSAGLLGGVFRGKREAALLLLANRRTEAGLPGGSSPNRTWLTPNAVEPGMWSAPRRERVPDAPVRFVFLGRLVRYKGVDLLLEAASRLPDDLDWRLEVIGDGNERSALEAQAAALGIASHVRFRGWLGGAALVEALSRADVFTFPSLREAGGAAVLEAMAIGLPVIAADWGGPAEFVTPECGVLVPVDAPDALIAALTGAMRRLGEDPALRERMGRAGRARVENGFLWKHRIDALFEQYERIAAQSFPEARLLPDRSGKADSDVA